VRFYCHHRFPCSVARTFSVFARVESRRRKVLCAVERKFSVTAKIARNIGKRFYFIGQNVWESVALGEKNV
jgi:hypothetical protein